MDLSLHPTARAHRAQAPAASPAPAVLDAAWLKDLARQAGADDVGLVDIQRSDLGDERAAALGIMPDAQTLMSLAMRLSPASVRCPSRDVADHEFRAGMERSGEVTHRVALQLSDAGVRAMGLAAGFPMDLSRWPGRMWPVSHKIVAQAAGLGRMGLSRMLLHPRLGPYMVLTTVLLDRPVSAQDQPLDFEPCLGCKLCVAVCPTGALSPDGHFNFANCITHNYRDRLGGFQDWVENLAASEDAASYRARVSDPETVSMWQSLSYGICNKSSYCLAVCPAGLENIGPFLEDRKAYTAAVARPLMDRVEDVYLVAGSDAQGHLARRFPHKRQRLVHNGLRPKSGANFMEALPLVFQRQAAGDLAATYHFTFTGVEPCQATVTIAEQTVTVAEGLQGKADLALTADSDVWVEFLAGERNLLWAVLRRKVKVRGNPKLLKAFAACFPS